MWNVGSGALSLGRRYFCLPVQRLPRISLVGRPNVGKSSLFNRIQSTQRNAANFIDKAIVYDRPGTTREGKSAMCQFGRLTVEIADTGGLEADDVTHLSPLLEKMRSKTASAIASSDVVAVVIDAKAGVTPLDKSVAEWVKKTLRPETQRVVLVANKAEGQTMFGEYVAECYEMDLGDPVLISAKQNEGIDDLYDRLVLELDELRLVGEEQSCDSDPEETDGGDSDCELDWDSPTRLSRNEIRRILKSTDPDDSAAKERILKAREQEALLAKTVQIGLIGRPNAGKSSVLNALIQEDRAIVDDRAGTTTDAIAVNWNFFRHKLRLVDTAGIMRGWKHASGREDFKDPGAQTLRTINTSHVCVLVLDAFETFRSGTLKFPSRQEVKLGNEVIDSGKCLVVAVNKWDLIPANRQAQLRRGLAACIAQAFHDLKGVPVVYISAKSGMNLNTLLVNCVAAYRKWNLKIPTSRLNSWLEAFVAHNPPPWKDGQKQYPKFITQTKSRPPTFSLYTNTFATFPDNYLRQMKELLKEEFGLRGVPLRINLRSTLMPKPGKRLRDRDMARWKRLGPKQAAAVERIRRSKPSRGGREHELD